MSGIVLNNTGAGGGLAVTGKGTAGSGGTIQKADVLAYVESGKAVPAATNGAAARLAAASPKARRLAAERGLYISVLPGSGPGGAVLAGDVAAAARPVAPVPRRRSMASATSGASWPSA